MKQQCFLAAMLVFFAVVCAAQEQPPAAQSSETSIPTIKKETRLVLVDTVVTDKGGNYVRDLSIKDFRVWQDNKEQRISSFSSETGASAADRRRYLVLFFDNTNMAINDQSRARNAALKFLDANTGPDRYIAIVDFGGTLRVSQNFTTDADRLKQVVRNLKFSVVAGPADVQASQPISASTQGIPQFGGPQLADGSANFAIRTLLLGLRDIAKGMSAIPGRKSLILFSAGFPLDAADPERESELTAAIDACNKANVAVYPIDVRGLVTTVGFAAPPQTFPDSSPVRLLTATLEFDSDVAPAHLLYVQHGGGGGGSSSGGGHTGGGTGGGTSGGTGGGARGSTGTGNTGGASRGNTTPQASIPSFFGPSTPYNQARDILPPVVNAAADQQVLYRLAIGTGGFVIVNSNNLLAGIQKIAQEQSQYYVLGYTPPDVEEGSCHTLRVKVDRHDSVVRSRSGFCNIRSTELLAGKPAEKQLEDRVSSSQPGNVTATMLAPYFYTSANTARVNLAIDMPPGAIKFEKKNGKEHAEIDILGVAYTSGGTVAAHFSDTAEFNLEDKKQVEQFSKSSYLYENQFEIAAGHYELKVAFTSGGQAFGKLELPLVIDNYDAKQFSMSAVTLSKNVHPVDPMSASLDAAMLEDRTPLVTQGMQVVPAGSDRFKKTDLVVFYIEMYDPMLTSSSPPKIDLQMKVLDRKTQEAKLNNDGPVPNVQPGTPVVTLGVKLPIDKLPPGSYQLELRATDSAGNSTPVRTADFELE